MSDKEIKELLALLLEARESVVADLAFCEHYSPYGADVIRERLARIDAVLQRS